MAVFKSFKVPVDNFLTKRFELAVHHLETKLQAIDIESLDVSAYSKKYFKDYQRKLKYSLQACSFILMHALKKTNKNIEEITIVDYGAGTGVLAMLASEVGFGKVIYNDIYDVSCKDAETIAKKASAKAHAYVCGDINVLPNYFNQNMLTCDIIVSRNVIEHIYDLNSYFKTLPSIPNDGLTLFFATTANIKNPLTVWYTNRIQRMLEFKGLTTKWGKERDTLKPYFISRKEIIEHAFPQLNEVEVNQLTANTRGLIKEEILEKIKTYLKDGTLPALKVSGYNTCDPNTGNWAEHLVKIDEYQHLFLSNSFDFKIVNGFYNTNYNLKLLNIVTPIVNFGIKILGNAGIYLAPFIGLQGQLKHKK
jgi:2-polyprenyl-3-methyl-5-hydroxy-6-metoxy-1,4-benzoquinol methylase